PFRGEASRLRLPGRSAGWKKFLLRIRVRIHWRPRKDGRSDSSSIGWRPEARFSPTGFHAACSTHSPRRKVRPLPAEHAAENPQRLAAGNLGMQRSPTRRCLLLGGLCGASCGTLGPVVLFLLLAWHHWPEAIRLLGFFAA